MSWQVSVGTLPRKPLSFTSSTVSPIASTWVPHQTACRCCSVSRACKSAHASACATIIHVPSVTSSAAAAATNRNGARWTSRAKPPCSTAPHQGGVRKGDDNEGVQLVRLAAPQRPHCSGLPWQRPLRQLRDGQPRAQDAQAGPRPAPAHRVDLRDLLCQQVGRLQRQATPSQPRLQQHNTVSAHPQEQPEPCSKLCVSPRQTCA